MANLFNPENRFWMFLQKVFDAAGIFLLWFLYCLPLFTVPAATTAMYRCMCLLAKNEEGRLHLCFQNTYKENFKKSLPVSIAFLILLVFLILDIQISSIYCAKLKNQMYMLLAACSTIIILWLNNICVLWSKSDIETKEAVRDGAILLLYNLPGSVILIFLTALIVLLSVYINVCFLIMLIYVPYIYAKYLNFFFEATAWENINELK